MKRTTISLPDDLAGFVEREARRRGASVSEIVRMALTSHFNLGDTRDLPFANLYRSGPTHTTRLTWRTFLQSTGRRRGFLLCERPRWSNG